MAFHGYITVDDIRLYILDRSIEDNDMDLDLSFSDEEIMAAMERVAREYNSIPPYVDGASPDRLSKTTNMFFDGILQQLYMAELNRAMRNDIDYVAGNVTTNPEKSRIANLTTLARDHGERFREAVRNRKIFINMSDGYGPVG